MRQELIDLIRGELGPEETRDLRDRLQNDAELSRELTELQQLFSFMRRGEEVEPQKHARVAIMAEAERTTRPSFVQQLRGLPGLIRYRFSKSLAFRVAAVSLTVHLIAMGILFQMSVPTRDVPENGLITILIPETPDLRPDDLFTRSLMHRRLPHAARLQRYGLEGQQALITRGLDAILASQKEDGSFGDAARTAQSTLALLAEGDCSSMDTRRGRAISRAVRHLIQQRAVHGAVLAALVEDWTLSFDEMGEHERLEYVHTILRLVGTVPDDEAGREGLAIAARAHIPVPSSRNLGVLARDPYALLDLPATRLSATTVLARGQKLSIPDNALREWLRTVFEGAKAAIMTEKPAPLAVLALQAPYRL